MQSIDRRPLGRSGLLTTRLGFGSAPLGDLYERLPPDQAMATVAAAWQAGVRFYDTAPLYGHGLAELRLGAELRRHRRDDFLLSTKVGRVYRPGADPGRSGGYVGALPFTAAYDYSYDGAMRSLEQSLLRLGVDRVDILLIHDVDVWTHGRDAIEQRFAEAMNGAYRALEDLRRQKVVGAIGVGINEADLCARFARAGDFDCFMLAGRYTLLEQGALDDFLPLCVEKGIGILLGGVFNSGILAGGTAYNYAAASPAVVARVEALRRVCAAHGVPLATAALHFAAAHPAVASLVLGAVRPEEVQANAAALAHAVPAALWSDLRAAGLVRADAPVPGG